MMRTPDGHGRVELTKFRRPTADSAEPINACGYRKVDPREILRLLVNSRSVSPPRSA